MAVLHVNYGGEVDIEPAGAHDSAVKVRYGENVVVLIMHDDLLHLLALKANRHLNRRLAERTLALLEAERERRRRAKEKAAEATAADAVVR